MPNYIETIITTLRLLLQTAFYRSSLHRHLWTIFSSECRHYDDGMLICESHTRKLVVRRTAEVRGGSLHGKFSAQIQLRVSTIQTHYSHIALYSIHARMPLYGSNTRPHTQNSHCQWVLSGKPTFENPQKNPPQNIKNLI